MERKYLVILRPAISNVHDMTLLKLRYQIPDYSDERSILHWSFQVKSYYLLK